MKKKVCSSCGYTAEQEGQFCQHCGAGMEPVEPQDVVLTAYVNNCLGFGEWIENFDDGKYTRDQLRAVYNFLYEVTLKFYFKGNDIEKVEVG